jgi:hypothetical protein
MHTYGLLYAHLCEDVDPGRAERFRDRAVAFVDEHKHWFDDEGAALPYGRSLTYRFAQAAFWGALALIDRDDLPWGQIRGLWARNMRWWADQPIFTDGGVLSIGYRYPSLKVSENYNSPGSPYWAMKGFLPLVAPADHPFWRVTESNFERETLVEQPEPGMVVCNDAASDHHFALLSGFTTGNDEKYTKFATSTTFGYSLRGRQQDDLSNAGHDSLIALRRRDDERWAIRTAVEASQLTDDGLVYSSWSLWDGLSAETWLAPALPWHVRVHRIETAEPIESAEGGFALSRAGDDRSADVERQFAESGVLARYPGGSSGIQCLAGDREPEMVDQDPNTNNLHPRTTVPTVRGEHEAGTHWLVTGVTGSPKQDGSGWSKHPMLEELGNTMVVRDPDGNDMVEIHSDTVSLL